jgi:hypothetical protein
MDDGTLGGRDSVECRRYPWGTDAPQPESGDAMFGSSQEPEDDGSSVFFYSTQAQTEDAPSPFDTDQQLESGTFAVFHAVKQEPEDGPLHSESPQTSTLDARHKDPGPTRLAPMRAIPNCSFHHHQPPIGRTRCSLEATYTSNLGASSCGAAFRHAYHRRVDSGRWTVLRVRRWEDTPPCKWHELYGRRRGSEM